MQLFVDANIYLDFYHFSNDDLDELKKLVDLVIKGEINLILTSQVIDEVRRNRDNKVADAYNKFRDSKISLSIPQICKTYPEYSRIMKHLESLRDAKSQLDEKLIADINNRTLKADGVIDQLFKGATVLNSQKYLTLARERFDLGNPPGKKGSYGDSVTWTTLISELLANNDLLFISDDIDYKSPLNEKLFHSFLLDEWKKLKKSDLFFYVKLSEFFNEHHEDIQLKVEGEKNELISNLSKSSSFAWTHGTIRSLSKYASFTDEQIRELSKIGIENSQVESILSDSDVKSFYEKLLEGNEHLIDPEALSKMRLGFLEHEERLLPNCPNCNNEAVCLGETCSSCGMIIMP